MTRKMKLTTRAEVVVDTVVVEAATTTALIATNPATEAPIVPRSENPEAEEAPVSTAAKKDICPENAQMSELNEAAVEVAVEPATTVVRKDTCHESVPTKGWSEAGVEEEGVIATTAVRLVIS